MRIARSTLIGTAVAMALFGRNGAVQAQAASGDQAAAPASAGVQEVVVTGIRYSLEQSVEQKRAATNVVDVVTAEDISKLPDKNVADALQRLPGVNISSAGATEGGFDEADRVSLRGTNPSLTLTLINGHNVSSGDWFVLNQTGTVGRSVSYTLLPAELVSKVVVQKSTEANFVEGGAAGTVDIITRRALDFQKPVTLEANAGAVYADLPGKTDPQFSALGNWINDDKNFGVLLQVFAENRHLQRQGQELLGYQQIAPGSNIATLHPDLANVSYPVLLGSTLFQQERKRTGGFANIEWQPNDNLNFDATGFLSKLEATNLNTNYLFWGSNILAGGKGQSPDPGYVVQNGTLVSASFAPVAGTNYGVYDQISRPDASASSNFGNLDVHLRATDALSFLGQFGVSEGHGRTPTQDVSETNPGQGNGAAYALHGITSAASWNLGNTINTTPQPGGVPVAFGWIFGDQNMDAVDRETWGKIDGDFKMDGGLFKSFKFGARYTDHDRHLWGAIGQGPGCNGEACPAGLPANSPQSPFNPLNYPVGFQNYPSFFGDGLGAGFPTGIWYWTSQQLSAYNLQFTNRDPITRADWTSDYGLKEKTAAGYLQLDFGGTGWAGNVGVRYVHTDDKVTNNVSATPQTPGVITTSAFGPYVVQTTDNSHNDILPSANLKFDLSPDLVARAAVGQTLARPDYSALASSISLGAPPPPGTVGSGSGANPTLKPIKATSGDLGLEWYFAPRSILAGDAFYMDLKNYVGFGSVIKEFLTFSNQFPNGYVAPYNVTVPINADGRVYGFEAQYQQTFFDHWGIVTNYTYADGKQTSNVPPGGTNLLVGTSKNTANAIGFFENAHFSARVAYTYRSAFYSGLDRSTAFSQGALGTLAASLGYIANDNFSITLDGLNLNNPRLKYFALNESQPRAFYLNGRQYYLTLHFKM
ncbi:MAG TPA: TonB-dependent receptor [Steroidobacteraceae bacterium]|nr:TonB-dependent receptor [Steroidobacteraceae bacterium]